MREWKELARGNIIQQSGFDNLVFKAAWSSSPSSYTVSYIHHFKISVIFFLKHIENKNVDHICELECCILDESGTI